MCSGVGHWACPQWGFPIRTSSDHSSVASSSRLIAGSYVLHRLLVPRHPPYALTNLPTIIQLKMLASTVQFSNYERETSPTPSAYPHPPPRTMRTVRPEDQPAPETTPAPEGAGSLRTQQRARTRTTHQQPRSTPHPPEGRHSSTSSTRDDTSHIIDVPPMSNHPGTNARAWPP